MTTLTAQQRTKLQFVTKTVTNLGDTFKIHGRLGTFEYLGIIPDIQSSDLAAAGISRTVQRPSGRRARWLGDTVGAPYAGSTANQKFFPTRDGNALPGKPITIVNLDETDAETGKPLHQGTVSVQGSVGAFIAWFGQNRPDFTAKLYSTSGKPYDGVIAPED
jgi:hypothetical protein